eukprot:Rhum_TRINITY_DN12777_c0_g2::Rhum_TRINITY_DN12777_c0_g2_i1::g.54271::m.54271
MAAALAGLLLATACVCRRTPIKVLTDRKKSPTASYSHTAPEVTTSRTEPCPQGSLLQVTFKPDSGTDKIYGNADVFAGHTINEGDKLEYEMLWEEPLSKANVDFEATVVGWRLRDDDVIKDQNGYSNHCEKETLHQKPFGTLYKRIFDLSPAAGKHLNTLVFSANPGDGVEATMLVSYIRILKHDGGVLPVWDDTQPPINVNAYFPGNIETSCKASYAIKGAGGCWGRGSRHRGYTDDHSEFISGASVHCDVDVHLEQGTAGTVPRMAVTGFETHIGRSDYPSLPPLYNASETLFPAELTSDAPIGHAFDFVMPDVCCHHLLADIYNGSQLTITALITDASTVTEMRKVMLSTPISLLCPEDFNDADIDECAIGECEDNVGPAP